MVLDFILEILPSATISGLLTAALLFLTRTWVSERLKNAIKAEYDQKLETHKSELKARNDSDIESHKAQLKSQSDVEIEKLKASLSIAASEKHIKFSSLHEERAKVIAETYSLLKDSYFKMDDYVKIFVPAGDSSREERSQKAVEAHQALRNYYPRKIIYLPKNTAEKLDQISKDLVNIFNSFTYEVAFKEPGRNTQKWNDIHKKMSGEMKDTLKDLEDEFRKLLGLDLCMAHLIPGIA